MVIEKNVFSLFFVLTFLSCTNSYGMFGWFKSVFTSVGQKEEETVIQNKEIVSCEKSDNKVDVELSAVELVEEFKKKEKEKLEKKFPKKTIWIGDNIIGAHVGNYKEREIVQLSVLDQMGGGSCGYQTIKNIIALFRSLEKKDLHFDVEKIKFFNRDFPEPDELEKKQNFLKTKLKCDGFAKQYFGSICSLWRKGIVRDRTVEQLKPLLKEKWNSCLTKPKELDNKKLKKDKLFSFYKNVLDLLVLQSSNDVVDEKEVDISMQNIKELSQYICSKITSIDIDGYSSDGSITKNELTDLLCSESMIKKHINSDVFSKNKITPNNYFLFLEKGEKECSMKKSGLGKRSKNGDWLVKEEMNKIISHEKKIGMLNDLKNYTCIIYDDLCLLGNPNFDTNDQKMRNAAKKTVLNPNHNVAICIGTMANGRGQLSGSSGHWFPLVRTKERYITMDSLGNKFRLDDGNVKKVIDRFEYLRNSYRVSSMLVKSAISNPSIFGNKEPFWPIVWMNKNVLLNIKPN